MKERTQYFSLRGYPDDIERIRALREQLQAQHPQHAVSMADVFRLAVGSASAVLASGGEIPVALTAPAPPIQRKEHEAA